MRIEPTNNGIQQVAIKTDYGQSKPFKFTAQVVKGEACLLLADVQTIAPGITWFSCSNAVVSFIHDIPGNIDQPVRIKAIPDTCVEAMYPVPSAIPATPSMEHNIQIRGTKTCASIYIDYRMLGDIGVPRYEAVQVAVVRLNPLQVDYQCFSYRNRHADNQRLAEFLNAIPDGILTLFAFSGTADGLKFYYAVRKALVEFGTAYANKLPFTHPWCIAGYKGQCLKIMRAPRRAEASWSFPSTSSSLRSSFQQ